MVIELTSEDQSKLSRLAETLHRSEAEISEDVLHWFLVEQEKSLTAAVQEGDDDFARGDVLEQQDVVAQFSDVLHHR